jgi:hypothetical protein
VRSLGVVCIDNAWVELHLSLRVPSTTLLCIQCIGR